MTRIVYDKCEMRTAASVIPKNVESSGEYGSRDLFCCDNMVMYQGKRVVDADIIENSSGDEWTSQL